MKHPVKSPKTPGTLRILTYNIHKGFNLLGTRMVLDGIREGLRQTSADIVFLQEVYGSHESHALQSQFEYLADGFWSHYSYGKNASYDKGHHGNAILSRFPIVQIRNIDLTQHRLESRGLLHVTIESPETGPIELYNTHLDLLYWSRKYQLSLIKNELMRSESGDYENPAIFAGDFNDWRGTASQALGWPEAFTELFGRPERTFPAAWPLLRLDRVYFRNLSPLHAFALTGKPWNLLSDHLPLGVDFELSSTGN